MWREVCSCVQRPWDCKVLSAMHVMSYQVWLVPVIVDLGTNYFCFWHEKQIKRLWAFFFFLLISISDCTRSLQDKIFCDIVLNLLSLLPNARIARFWESTNINANMAAFATHVLSKNELNKCLCKFILAKFWVVPHTEYTLPVYSYIWEIKNCKTFLKNPWINPLIEELQFSIIAPA
mgnify:CR=1 FL=1